MEMNGEHGKWSILKLSSLCFYVCAIPSIYRIQYKAYKNIIETHTKNIFKRPKFHLNSHPIPSDKYQLTT